MSSKRKSEHGSAPAVNSSPSSYKRARTSNGNDRNVNSFVPRREKPSVNQTYGQMSAIPGLDDLETSDDSGEDADDDEDGTKAALRYLRTVRNERHGIPDLLVAPKQATASASVDSDEGIEDPRGYYEDGAYVAAPVLGPVRPVGWQAQGNGEDESAVADLCTPQEAYTRRLLALYRTGRKTLQAYNGGAKRKHENMGYNNTWKSFDRMVQSHAPSHSRLATLQQDTILRMLHNACHGLQRKRNLTKEFSQWIWALLCALGDVYTLDSDAVSIVRELGKKAVWVGIGYIGAEEADATAAYAEDEEEAPYDDEDEDGEKLEVIKPEPEGPALSHPETTTNIRGRRRNTSSPEPPSEELQSLIQDTALSTNTYQDPEMEEAKRQLLSRIVDRTPAEEEQNIASAETRVSYPDDNTRATLDMIITIAGEMYGQRDLLEFRTVWAGLWGQS